MYCSHWADAARRSAQSVQFHLLDSLTRVLAPILPHLCEEACQYHPLSRCKSATSLYVAESVGPEGCGTGHPLVAIVTHQLFHKTFQEFNF